MNQSINLCLIYEFCVYFFAEYDECSSMPCLNGAQCIDRPGYYECICTDGWQGQTCATGTEFIKISIPYCGV